MRGHMLSAHHGVVVEQLVVAGALGQPVEGQAREAQFILPDGGLGDRHRRLEVGEPGVDVSHDAVGQMPADGADGFVDGFDPLLQGRCVERLLQRLDCLDRDTDGVRVHLLPSALVAGRAAPGRDDASHSDRNAPASPGRCPHPQVRSRHQVLRGGVLFRDRDFPGRDDGEVAHAGWPG